MTVPLYVESWVWYSVATLVLVTRMVARSMLFGGIHRLKLEDMLMFVALVFYTNEIVWMNIVATEQSNLLPPGYLKHHKLSLQEVDNRAYGSKITLVVEQCQCVTIWTIKGCLLLMYYRLTENCYPKHHLAVKILAYYVVFGFVFMEIFYFAVWCRPFPEYWAVPTSNPKQCAAAWNHLITNAVFNMSSDLAMLIIALSMAFRLKLARQQKYGLLSLIILGFFVIACAMANKGYSFTNPYGSQWTYWYIRECSTAMLIANLPYVWSLFRRLRDEGLFRRRRSSQSVTSSKRKRSLSCFKSSDQATDVMSGQNLSLPEMAHFSEGRSKTSDPESGRANDRTILGKADALALEDLDEYELPMSLGATPRSTSPHSPQSDSAHTPQTSAGAPEHTVTLEDTETGDDVDRASVNSQQLTALPNSARSSGSRWYHNS